MRIGIGYDIHKLSDGRPLILGGAAIPYHQGLEGHSDADVLVHAVCDALLGAAGMGDIGEHFPDDDPRFENVRSLELLETVSDMLGREGFCVINIDATIVAQTPKLSPHIKKMEKNIGRALNISESRINVKATTSEGLGPVGRHEGISTMSVALLGMEEDDTS